jgi:hypothetical protein
MTVVMRNRVDSRPPLIDSTRFVERLPPHGVARRRVAALDDYAFRVMFPRETAGYLA